MFASSFAVRRPGRPRSRRAAARWVRLAVALAAPSAGALLVLATPSPALAQYQAPSDKLLMTAKSASTWSDGATDVVQLEGPVRIEFERATLTAQQAVVWLTPEAGGEAGRQRAQVVLVGDAKVVQQGAVRTGDRMVVNASVAGRINLTADERVEREQRGSALYRLADGIRNPQVPAPETRPALAPGPDPEPEQVRPGPTTRPAFPVGPATNAQPAGANRPGSEIGPSSVPVAPPAAPTTSASSLPSTSPFVTAAAPVAPVLFDAPELELAEGDDGNVIAVLSKGVKLFHRRATGETLEIQGQRVVLFTPLKNLKELQQRGGGIKEVQDAVTAAYVEGDVRVVFTPTPADAGRQGEQRLEARRVYYEFTTDRAVLTDAVLRTVDPKAQLPFTVHAKTIRQLALREYATEGAELSTSAFATPTYSIRADKIYVRQDRAGEVGAAEPRTVFDARNATFRTFGVPFFYLPRVGGSLTDQQLPLRTIGFEQSTVFGTGFLSEWGLFETLGQSPPRDLDATYRLDYYSERGPAGGVSARYQGGFVTETTRQPTSFEGEFRSYFVYDHGVDEIGRPIVLPPGTDPEEDRFRGHAIWEHQHLFPDGWQAQLRAGYVSDQTFLEQWFPREFDRGLPHDVSAYLKRQRDTEAFTLLLQFQPNDVVTTADLLQEQFEVEHLPELGYHRVGDDVGGRATFFSDNTVAGLHYQPTRYSLLEQGFVPGISPGIPSAGRTGTTDDTVWRGDFRQEVDFPFSAGHFRVVPYVMGRYTVYSDSPADSTIHRLFGGVGARVTTAFWKVDDTIDSDFFDVHRLRHVVEPELNAFASATTKDYGDVFLFDENVDPVNDVTAVQLALRQRWQTYRGGPGRWRSVDFLTVNVEANLFNNLPDELARRPVAFRGLFFASQPELSVPRNSVNADLTWRVADTTAILADVQWNADHSKLATASVGLVAQRDERLSYYVGNRYIDELNSNITSVAFDYQITPKYNIAVGQSFDFGVGENVISSASIIRRFDTVFVVVKASYDALTEQSAVGFNIVPRGLRAGIDSDVLNTALETNRR